MAWLKIDGIVERESWEGHRAKTVCPAIFTFLFLSDECLLYNHSNKMTLGNTQDYKENLLQVCLDI